MLNLPPVLTRSIELASIIIPDTRQRRDFNPEALQELVSSIEDNGLMHAPVLRTEGNAYHLVAGERRLRAIRQIFELGGSFVHDETLYTAEQGLVPFSSLGDLSPLEAMEAELDENLKRRDLTWQEHAAAVRALHDLRIAQGEASRAVIVPDSESPATPAWTVADTAEEVTGRRDGAYHDSVRKELIVAKHLHNPAVAKAKSTDEAFKILKKQEEAQRNVDLAATIGTTFSAESHTLHNLNCIHWMHDQAYLPDDLKFDVILTDPPYGMGAHEFGDAGGKLTGIEHHYDDSYQSWKELMSAWTAQSFHITKPQAHAYVFCDIDRFHELKAMMENAGWYVFRTPLINHKLNSGRVPLPDRGPRRQYEIILYAIKGNKPTTHIYPDVISTSADENFSHGAQKPVSLYQNLLQRSVRPGDRVLDSFAGSGTIFEAAHTYKCFATGIEMNPEYYGMCLRRLEKLKSLETPDIFA